MGELLEQIFTTARYETEAQKDRARMIYAITVLVLVIFPIYALFVTGNVSGTMVQEIAAGGNDLIATVVFYLCGVGTIIATRNGWERISGIGPVVMVFLLMLSVDVPASYLSASVALLAAGLILTAGFLNGMLGIAGGLILTTLTLVAYTIANPNDDLTFSRGLGIVLELVAIAGVVYLYLRNNQFSRRDVISQASEDRLKLAQISTEIAQHVSRRMDLNQVLNDAVEQICASYPQIYHAQIFLVDHKERAAKLAASTGPTGQLLLQRKHQLDVGSQSVIGQVTEFGRAIIARANPGVGETVHRRNEFLPDTQVEAAFPLRIGDLVIGALDMQSRFDDAFKDVDVPIYQSLADNIAIAIDNARLFEETNAQLRENERLVEKSREALREVERLNRQLTGRVWDQYLDTKAQESLALSVDFATGQQRPEADVTPSLVEAMEFNYPVQQVRDNLQVIAVPLRVRGTVIGAMEFELDENGNISPEDLDLIQEVGERFGLAVENSRLFEESQRVAQREAMVNEIGTRLQTSTNVETVLAEAARSLKQTLNVNKVAIRLGTPPASANGMRGNGKV